MVFQAQDPKPKQTLIGFSFASDPRAVRDALDRIGRMLLEHGVPQASVQPSCIVLAEVFNNVVEHAYGGEPGHRIAVLITPVAGGLAFVVSDRGGAMPEGPLPGARYPELDPNAPHDWPEGGFGWAMVRDLTRDLVYERQRGENTLRFKIMAENA